MRRRLAWIWLLAGLSIAAVLYASTGLGAGRGVVLGELRIRGTVTVAPADGSAPLHITDTTYAYRAGNGLRTGEGAAALALAQWGGLAFGPGTAATVDRGGASVAVALEAGAVAYAVRGKGDLRIEAGDAVVTPVSGYLTAVRDEGDAGGPPGRAGLVSVGADGQVKVYAYTGRLEVRRGDVVQVVEAGREVSFREGQLLSTRPALSDPNPSPWTLVLGALAGVVGIAAAFLITSVKGVGRGTARPF
jgi:hypothetical protein